MTDIVEEMRNAIWREDHYDPKLCGCDIGCAYCEPHDDDTPDNWPADKERAERQARAAYEVMARSGEGDATLSSEREILREAGRELVEFIKVHRLSVVQGMTKREEGFLIEALNKWNVAALDTGVTG